MRDVIRIGALAPVAAALVACSSAPPAPIVKVPVSDTRTDLTPTRSTADNMVRLDAQLRSGCASVTNIDRPDGEPTEGSPQRWVAHTCHGDLRYDVMIRTGATGPVVEVLPAGDSLDKPANPNFKPAHVEEDNADNSSGDASGISQAAPSTGAPASAPEPASAPAK